MFIAVAIAATRIHAVKMLAVIGELALVTRDHVRPNLINVSRLSKIYHIRRIASCRTHVDFKPDEIAYFA